MPRTAARRPAALQPVSSTQAGDKDATSKKPVPIRQKPKKPPSTSREDLLELSREAKQVRRHLNDLRERANRSVAIPLDKAGDGLADAMLMIEAAIARVSKPADEPQKAGVDSKRAPTG